MKPITIKLNNQEIIKDLFERNEYLEAENKELVRQEANFLTIIHTVQKENRNYRKLMVEIKDYLEDMASFECFCCNLPKLSSELLIKIDQLEKNDECR